MASSNNLTDNWNIGNGTSIVDGNYVLNSSYIDSGAVTIEPNFQTDTFELFYRISKIGANPNKQQSNIQIEFWDASGDFFNINNMIFTLVEDEDVIGLIVKSSNKVVKVQVRIWGTLTVHRFEMYATTQTASVDVATYTNVGVLKPKETDFAITKEGELSLKAGGGSNPTSVAVTNSSLVFTVDGKPVTYALTKNAQGQITKVTGNGLDMTVVRG